MVKEARRKERRKEGKQRGSGGGEGEEEGWGEGRERKEERIFVMINRTHRKWARACQELPKTNIH